MAEKDTILYFDDEPMILDLAEIHFGKNFPNHKLYLRMGKRTKADKIFSSIGGIERIAIICTDGSLLETFKGWDLVRDFRNSGYNGPTIYTGNCHLEKEDKPLFNHIINKEKWEELIEVMKGYLLK